MLENVIIPAYSKKYIQCVSVMELQPFSEEILEIIISNIQSSFDLLKCRLVSRQWHRIVTPICRQRHVRIKTSWLKLPNAPELFTVFQNCANVPWSSCYFANYDAVNENRVFHAFLQLFGKGLAEATLNESHCDKILTYLQMTPNLIKLSISGVYLRPIGGLNLSDSEAPTLSNLQVLELDQPHMRGEFPLNFLEFIVNATGCKLKKLVITNLCLKDELSAQKFETLLYEIPIISISVNYLESSELSLLSFLTEFQNICREEGRETPLREAIAFDGRIKHLEGTVLEFQFISSRNFQGAQCNGKVKSLEVKFQCVPAVLYRNVNFVSSFVSASFLERSGLVLRRMSIRGRTGSVMKGYLLPFGSIFPTVRCVEIVPYHGNFFDDWMQTFPVIQSLTIEATVENLYYTCTRLTRLEHLVLHIRHWNTADNFLSSKLCDVEKPPGNAGNFYTTFQDQVQIENPLEKLASLRMLEIYCLIERKPILSEGIAESLMRMRPLEALIIHNIWVRENHKADLTSRHKSFQHYISSNAILNY